MSTKFSHRFTQWIGLISCFFLSTHLVFAAKLQHVEPAFWWSGMDNQNLQVMVHGEGIGQAQVSVNYPGVRIDSMQTTDNPNYLFVNLILDEQVAPGSFDLTFEIADKQVANYQYELKARRKNSAQRKGFSSEDVIYLVTPDRFANGNPDNDSVSQLKESVNRSEKGGRHGGDLQGIIRHLDYLSDMGFTQIWPMPIMQNDMQNYSYHGYSTTDYYQVDSRFGSNELYRELSQKATEHGIGIIQDVILNHIGSEHWWMSDLPSEDWINNGGVFKPSSHMREALHDPHGTESDKKAFNDGWFVPTMPDLNQRNPLLANYLIQNTIWWIEYADLSGLRVDTYSYSDMAFLSNWTKRVMAEYPNLNIVGEEWSVNPNIVAFWQRGSKRYSEYDSALPSVMDFPLQAKLVRALTEKESWATGLRELYETIATDFVYGDPYNLVVFGDNHDMSRLFTQLNEEYTLLKMAMNYLMTTRGIPQVFYGTEILMANPGTDDHGIIRSDFPGGWPNDPANGFTGEGLTEQQKSAQQHFKQLLNWRKSSHAVTQGKLTHYAPKDAIYVYFRHTESDSVMVVVNKNKQPMELPLERFNQMLQGFDQATEVMSKSTYKIAKTIKLDEKGVFIYQLH